MNRFNTFAHRVLGKSLFGAAMLACALAGLAGAGPDLAPPAALAGGAELPTDWQGRPLRPLALSRVEQRFAERFPGRIARLTDGRQIVVLRDVDRPTRMLHPAVDCYRALGYRIEGEQLERVLPPRSPADTWSAAPRGGRTPPSGGRAAGWSPVTAHATPATLWPAAAVSDIQRCFTARKGGTALRVCEQIEDAAGQRFADTSAWFWAATTGRSTGPWRAVTVTRVVGTSDV
ncbi:MAG: hypothetical protein LCH89_15985 [Proteobacteria bacterium]|nr:hypothetical protein [Pseudomonadota bacterium]